MPIKYNPNKETEEEYLARRRGYSYKSREKCRIEVLTHYGGGKLACVYCGFSDIRALSIDHIANDGARGRGEFRAGTIFYGRLKQNDFPEGYQTLCMNCQTIKYKMEQQRKRLPYSLGLGIRQYGYEVCGDQPEPIPERTQSKSRGALRKRVV